MFKDQIQLLDFKNQYKLSHILPSLKQWYDTSIVSWNAHENLIILTLV